MWCRGGPVVPRRGRTWLVANPPAWGWEESWLGWSPPTGDIGVGKTTNSEHPPHKPDSCQSAPPIRWIAPQRSGLVSQIARQSEL